MQSEFSLCNVNVVPAKKTRKSFSPRWVWDKTEVDVLLQHVKKNIHQFERPNAQTFYVKLAKSEPILADISWTVMRDKMRNLRQKYKTALQSSNNDGAQLEGAVRENLKKLCPHFDDLEYIFGDRISNTLFMLDSEAPIKVELIDGDDPTESSNHTSQSENYECEDNVTVFPSARKMDRACTPCHEFQTRREEKSREISHLKVHRTQFIKGNKLELLKEKLDLRNALQEEKIALERSKFEWQLERDKKMLDLESKKVEIKEMKIKEELRLKEIELTEDLRLREEKQKNYFTLEKMKIDKEVMAIKLELERMKNNQ